MGLAVSAVAPSEDTANVAGILIAFLPSFLLSGFPFSLERFYAGVYDLAPERFAAQRAYILRMADLVGREDELTRNLSVGWRQRLALGAATIHDPSSCSSTSPPRVSIP